MTRVERKETKRMIAGSEEGSGEGEARSRGAREKRGVMSSAFAQPLTGFIRVDRVCARGLVESPPV